VEHGGGAGDTTQRWGRYRITGRWWWTVAQHHRVAVAGRGWSAAGRTEGAGIAGGEGGGGVRPKGQAAGTKDEGGDGATSEGDQWPKAE
jgi:hypothetical protein